MKSFEEFQARLDKMKRDYEEAVVADGRKIIGETAKELFEEFPALKGIRWTQYTPYFMDGDECIFGCNELQFLVGTTEERNARRIAEIEKEIAELSDPKTRPHYYSQKDAESQVKRYNDELETRRSGKLEEEDEDIDWENDGLHRKDDPMGRKLDAFERMVQGLDGALKIIFGDHCKVSIMRDGELEVDDHDHD